MNEEKVKEFYTIIDMYETSLYGLKWINSGGKGDYTNIISQNEYILRQLLLFAVNNVGLTDD